MNFKTYSSFHTTGAPNMRAHAPAERDARARPGETLSRREVRRLIAEMIG